MQVMCDSLVYMEADSIFDFYGEPVLWSEENQLTAKPYKGTYGEPETSQDAPQRGCLCGSARKILSNSIRCGEKK